ncbi:mechanosensitive ion channel family protein [Halarchaeum sp. CBA1220]|uniref:mechanosensitive ion channel family protein n=1 Tax=Halarchaeum sp. CBA1220 TaxID=1853682 RepID=UPI000F3A870F|nr:mechanosensitive ion channel family protein [Halarchaeum sp. CBA1220]QLC32745.1 mechanosensitive ion channel family protein [Halarchaeum sp. CBA1220]
MPWPLEIQEFVAQATRFVHDFGVVFAVLAIVVSWYAGRVLTGVLGRRVARRFMRPSVTRTVLRLIRTGVLFVGIVVALWTVGLGLGNLFVSVTVFSAVLGIVLAPIVGSIINGIFVLADQPYEIGDMIEFTETGQRGFVEDITLRYTKVFTLDNTFLVMPNGEMRETNIVNYSAEDERTRLSLTVQVTYESDVEAARGAMERAAARCEEVIEGGPDIRIGSARYPAKPTCYLEEFADSGIDLTLRYWAKQPYRLPGIRSNVQRAIREEFEGREDVAFAYPHVQHVFDEESGEANVALRRRQ